MHYYHPSNSFLWCFLTSLVLLQVLFQDHGGVIAASSGRIQFEQLSYTADEKSQGLISITVRRVNGTDGEVTAYLWTASQEGLSHAIESIDYEPVVNQSITWADSDASDKHISVKLIDDSTYEASDETFQLEIRTVTGGDATIFDEYSVTTVTISGTSDVSGGVLGFESPYVISTVESSLNEVLSIPVTRTGGSDGPVSVQWTVSDDTTAVRDLDFTIDDTQTLEWESGDTSVKYLAVSILDDTLYEEQETFSITLHTPSSHASINTVRSTATIQIAGVNDLQAGVITFKADCFPGCAAHEYIFEEGAVVQVIVSRAGGGSDGKVTVDYSTVDGTSTSLDYYTPTSGTLTWEHEDSTDRVISVLLLKNDKVAEGDSKVLYVTLSNVTGGATFLNSAEGSPSATIHILPASKSSAEFQNLIEVQFTSNPTPVYDTSILRNTYLQEEAWAVDVFAVSQKIVVQDSDSVVDLLVRRRGVSSTEAISVKVETADQSAIAGFDYVPIEATVLTFPATTTTTTTVDQVVSVSILHNPLPRTYDVSFMVVLSNVEPVGSAVLGPLHTQEIIISGSNNDVGHITAFDLDMNTGVLTITTSVAVDADSFDPTKIQLQSTTSNNINLTAGSTTSSDDGTSIVVQISDDDLNAIKRSSQIASTNTVLAADAGVFTFDNAIGCVSTPIQGQLHPCVQPEFSAATLGVTNFVADTTEPYLSGYTLDLGFRYIKLHFSEAIVLQDFCISCLSLYDDAAGTNAPVTLADSFIQTPDLNPLGGVLSQVDGGGMAQDGTGITLVIGDQDFASISNAGNALGQSRETTFLSISSSPSSSISDYAGNTIELVTRLQASASDCSECPDGFYTSSSCTSTADRVCSVCSTCTEGVTYAASTCTSSSDTVCHPCSSCARAGFYASTSCSPTTNTICSKCTSCTSDEYIESQCTSVSDRVCASCDKCDLLPHQEVRCRRLSSVYHRRRLGRSPYGCPVPGATYQTLEERLQAQKSNACGAGRCSCSGNVATLVGNRRRNGNFNPYGKDFPNDIRCTGPESYGIQV